MIVNQPLLAGQRITYRTAVKRASSWRVLLDALLAYHRWRRLLRMGSLCNRCHCIDWQIADNLFRE
jgi:hypothetical protein